MPGITSELDQPVEVRFFLEGGASGDHSGREHPFGVTCCRARI
jgi:hypothetical protein